MTGGMAAGDLRTNREFGVRSLSFQRNELTRYEALYQTWPSASPQLPDAVTGAVRNARLSRRYEEPAAKSIHEIAAGVAAPILTGFVSWLLFEAQQRDIDRIYFMARDGQILREIAERLSLWRNLRIECRYLYASRQALFLPSFFESADIARYWATEALSGRTLRTLLARVEFDVRSNSALLAENGFPAETWDTSVGERDLPKLNTLFGNPALVDIVLARAGEKRLALVDYLRQEGLTGDRRCGIVDLGWHGRLQRSLDRVVVAMSGAKHIPLVGFYFGLAPQTAAVSDMTMQTYCEPPHPDAELLEMFSSANHGTVRGYEREASGRVVPILAEPEGATNARRILVQHEAILSFVGNLTAMLKPADAPPATLAEFLRSSSRRALNLFAHFPSRTEASTYGSFVHDEDQSHGNPVDLAPELGRMALVQAVLRRVLGVSRIEIFEAMIRSDFRKVFWIEGSIVRSSRSRFERNAMLHIYGLLRRMRDTISYTHSRRRREFELCPISGLRQIETMCGSGECPLPHL
jgi:hypothetical protein